MCQENEYLGITARYSLSRRETAINKRDTAHYDSHRDWDGLGNSWISVRVEVWVGYNGPRSRQRVRRSVCVRGLNFIPTHNGRGTGTARYARAIKYKAKDKIPNTPFILASLSLHISDMGVGLPYRYWDLTLSHAHTPHRYRQTALCTKTGRRPCPSLLRYPYSWDPSDHHIDPNLKTHPIQSDSTLHFLGHDFISLFSFFFLRARNPEPHTAMRTTYTSISTFRVNTQKF